MATFYAWVIATTAASTDGLVAALVRQAFRVSPLASDGTLTLDGEASCLIALCLEKDYPPETSNCQKIVLDGLKTIYKKMGATYHSIIVLERGGSCQWTQSNITLPAQSTKTAYDRLNEEVENGSKEEG